ncbi:hemerythrin domain-containing protein [Hydrogenophaga sp. NFH-34]|uniref:hemerythrin domain-containing protein n=1 Tax=Hydrogenophaga sp. NFH-34 TaxID=2744446 RepID=UPI001F4517DD|nr:hemerythrin domain-containing protein [Hydrogenophaga sp. NFH-34]
MQRIPLPVPGAPPSPAAGFEAPFDMLGACHERVARMLRLLARLREHAAGHGADTAGSEAARDVMRYFDVAGPLHHQDEERHVFPVLLAQGDAVACRTVGRLLDDHRAMEAGWAQVRQALQRLRDAVPAPAFAFTADEQAQMDAYAALYARHLTDEDGIAYPAAQALLQPAQLQAMSADMQQRRLG